MSETNANEITKADEGRFVRLTKMTPAEADIAAFVNMLNAGASIEAKTATETPAKPEVITAEQLRNEALNVVRQIANGRPPESSLQYDAALYLLENAYRLSE